MKPWMKNVSFPDRQGNVTLFHGARRFTYSIQFSSVTESCPTLQLHESQHTRPPCSLPSPGVHSDSRPSSQWCHPAISSSVAPSPPAPNPSQHQSFPTLRMRWPKYWSFSFSIIPSKEIPGLISFRMDWLEKHFKMFFTSQKVEKKLPLLQELKQEKFTKCKNKTNKQGTLIHTRFSLCENS